MQIHSRDEYDVTRRSSLSAQLGGFAAKLPFLQVLQPHHITRNERFLLGSGPSLQLALPPETMGAACMLLCIDDAYGPALCGVDSGDSVVMSSDTTDNVVGLSNVVRPIGASQDVEKPHRTTMPSSLDK